MRAGSATCRRSAARSPGSRPRSVRTCQGLGPRRTVRGLALTPPSVLPSAVGNASASGVTNFRGSMAGLHDPLPTLRRYPHGDRRTARGRCGSLFLHRSGLSPPTPCQSPGALPRFLLLSTDLTRAKGLETCLHTGPCTIDHRTLQRSGPLPLAFLRGVGLWLIPLSQVSLDSEPPTGHDRGRWPFLTRSSHFSNGFRTKRTAPSSCLSAAGRMASFVLGAVGSGVTC